MAGKSVYALLLILLPTIIFSQWSSKTVQDPFDGEIIYATGVGQGGRYPYKNPREATNPIGLDVKTIKDEEFEKLNSLDVLVLSALRIEPHPSHLNLEEALAMVERIQPKKTYFTHISHLLGFHDEVEANLPKNVHLAFDNLQITSS